MLLSWGRGKWAGIELLVMGSALFCRYVYINLWFQTVYLFTSQLRQVVYTRMMFEI